LVEVFSKLILYMFFNYISLPVFLVSFAIGLFFIYVLGPEMKKIYIYPSPETINKVLFKDKADNCFYFEEEIVECPKDESLISKIPIQT
jgi:isoprenylcysteine carboxyl methyltransferase (ICMT) family protein YpbQ